MGWSDVDAGLFFQPILTISLVANDRINELNVSFTNISFVATKSSMIQVSIHNSYYFLSPFQNTLEVSRLVVFFSKLVQ